MTREEILEFCGAWLSSWTGNNPEKLLDYYTEDAFYSDPANKGGLRGRQQLLKYFTRLLAANPGWKWEAVEVFPTEGGFTLKWKAAIPVGNQIISE
ncbi:MAG: YybH family protein, partial [Desulfocucumaceae bacterium]